MDEKKLQQRIESRFRKALREFRLIDDGDKVLVGLSGGKDSLCLLELLALRSRIDRPKFDVEAVHIRMENIHYETSSEYLERFAANLGVKIHVLTTGFDESTDRRKSRCFLCSWNRRKLMFRFAQDNGFNKIALGHHMDDIIHTALMNEFFQGQFSTMPAILHMKKMPLAIIRPLAMEHEEDIKAFAQLRGYEKQVKLCPYETDSHRSDIKSIFSQIETMNPEARYSVWNALMAAGKLVE